MIFFPPLNFFYLCCCLCCELTGRAKPSGIVFPPVLERRSLSSAALDMAKKNGKCRCATTLVVGSELGLFQLSVSSVRPSSGSHKWFKQKYFCVLFCCVFLWRAHRGVSGSTFTFCLLTEAGVMDSTGWVFMPGWVQHETILVQLRIQTKKQFG